QERLITQIDSVHPQQTKEEVVQDLFDRYSTVPLIDKYKAYGILDDVWTTIANDIELIQKDSLEVAARAVDPNMVIKKKDGKETEVQEGTKGRIFSFELIQQTLLKDESEVLSELESRQTEIQEELTTLIESLSEDDGEYTVLNDANDKFKAKETRDALKEELENVDLPELNTLADFRGLAGKDKRVEFMKNHPEIRWNEMSHKKDGTPTNKGLNDYEINIQMEYQFDEDTFGYKLSKAVELMEEEKQVKKDIKEKAAELIELTEEVIINLSDEQIS